VTVPTALAAALIAARQGARHELCRLVDWPLSGVARMVRALHQVDEGDRRRVVARGLAELGGVAPHDATVAALSTRLAAVSGTRPASPAEQATALETIRPPAPPPGLTPARARQLARLAERTRAVTEVWIAEHPSGRHLPIAILPDSGRLLLCTWPI